MEKPLNGTCQNVRNISWWLIIGLTLFASAWLHALADFALPLPWPDEASFLWPAINLAEHGTLLAPELNFDRPIMWMPPGYMVLGAIVIKLVGFSLESLRWLSWLQLGFTYILLSLWLRSLPLRFISLTFLSLFMVSGPFVAAGNVARMDVITLLMAVVAFMSLSHGRVWSALVVLSIAALFHPNALYFGLAATVAALVMIRDQRWRPTRADLAVLLIAVIAWIAYAVHVAMNWDGFCADMAIQFARKSSRHPSYWLLLWPTPAYLAVLGLLALQAARRRSSIFLPIAFAAASLFVAITGREMWYGVYAAIGWLFLGLAVLWTLHAMFPVATGMQRAVRNAVLGLASIALVPLCHRNGWIESPGDIPARIEWWQMTMPKDGVRYFTAEDRAAISEQVRSRFPAGRRARIAFLIGGDALFFHKAFGDHATPYAARFTPVEPDAYLVHNSRYLPPSRRDENARHLRDSDKPFRERDGTEQWFLVDRTAK